MRICNFSKGDKDQIDNRDYRENIAYCQELMNIVYEVRHLEGVKVNFGVSESDYVATAIQQQEGGQSISQLIHSNARVMIEQQQYFFETLWNKAIAAEQRIRELRD
jgi:two-component system, OmpR family, sensor histidine kinase VicK